MEFVCPPVNYSVQHSSKKKLHKLPSAKGDENTVCEKFK